MENESFEELLSHFNKKESIKRKTNILIILLILLIGLFFTIFAVTKIFYVEKQTAQITIAKDSLEKVTQTLNMKTLKEDSIKKIVRSFLNRKTLSDDSIAILFTDTVERYYLMEDISRYDLIKEDRKFWNRFPLEVFQYDSTFAINIIDTSCVSVLITGTYRRTPNDSKNMIQEIKLNSALKLFYVRAFINEK